MSKKDWFDAWLQSRRGDLNVNVKIDIDWLWLAIAVVFVMVAYRELFL